MLSKEASSTIFWVFGMTWPWNEPQFAEPWQTLSPLGQWSGYIYIKREGGEKETDEISQACYKYII